jgi:hypothetical protein
MLSEEEFGPAMRALTPRQRRYVLAMAADPLGTPTGWCRAAGYSDSSLACKVRGHALSHSVKVARAVSEVATQLLTTYGPMLGIGVVMRIARNDRHPRQLAAATALLDRTGFGVQTEHRVVVDDVRRDPEAMVQRIREIAGRLGIDAEQLLNGMRRPKLVEHEAPAAEAGDV